MPVVSKRFHIVLIILKIQHKHWCVDIAYTVHSRISKKKKKRKHFVNCFLFIFSMSNTLYDSETGSTLQYLRIDVIPNLVE